MKGRKKSGFILLIILLFSINLVCCSKKEEAEIGKYIEEDFTLADNISYIFSVKEISDNIRYLAGKDESGQLLIYYGQDKLEPLAIKDLPKDIFVSNCNINNKGDTLVSYLENEDSEEQKFLIVDSNGNVEKLNIQEPLNSIDKFIFDKQNSIIFIGDDNTIYQYEISSNKITNKKTMDEDIMDYTLVNDELILFTSSQILKYDLADEVKELKSLEDKVLYSEEDILKVNLAESSNKDKLYLANGRGVYSYDLKNEEIEMVINANGTLMANTQMMLLKLFKISDKDFVVEFLDSDGSKDTEIYEIRQYSYRTDYVEQKEKLTIYSLYENQLIYDLIRKYEAENSKVDLEYTFAISGDNGITETDAVKTLNTEMMAGKGPDILLMDNLETREYIDSGMLENISEVVNNSAEKDYLFNNIINIFSQDEEIYAIPLGIKLPFISGKQESIEEIISLEKLNEIVNNSSINILHGYNLGEIASKLLLWYFIDDSWQNDEDSLNQGKLDLLINTLDDIKAKREAMNINYEGETGENIRVDLNIGNNSLALLDEYNGIITIGTIDSMNSLSKITSFDNGFTLEYSVLGDKCLAADIFAVNAKSNSKALAMDFISKSISSSYQEKVGRYSMPINRNVYSSLAELYDEDEMSKVGIRNKEGKDIDYELKNPTEEEVNRVIGEIDKISEVINYNNKYLNIFEDSLEGYIKGEYSSETLKSKIINELKISLSE